MSAIGLSESEDDPGAYESSGSEWNSTSELEIGRKVTRRTSARISKKPRLKSPSSSDSEVEQVKTRKRNGTTKRQKTDTLKNVAKVIHSKDFSTGSFLILKKDAQVGDPKIHPCIWRIDGKALLQKYEPFEEDGIIRHRTTSIYTGWSALDRDLYAPVMVSVRRNGNHTLIVDLNWETLKEINMDSD